MAAGRLPLTVSMEDGSTVDVVADQRDMAAYERIEKIGWPNAMEDRTISAIRHVAYLALRRTGKVDGSVGFEAWADQAVNVDAEVEEDVPLASSASGPKGQSAEG